MGSIIEGGAACREPGAQCSVQGWWCNFDFGPVHPFCLLIPTRLSIHFHYDICSLFQTGDDTSRYCWSHRWPTSPFLLLTSAPTRRSSFDEREQHCGGEVGREPGAASLSKRRRNLCAFPTASAIPGTSFRKYHQEQRHGASWISRMVLARFLGACF